MFPSIRGTNDALGGHIHIGSSDRGLKSFLKEKVEDICLLLDAFVGRVLLPTSGRLQGEITLALASL